MSPSGTLKIPICPFSHIKSLNLLVWSVGPALYAYNICSKTYLIYEKVIYDSPIVDIDFCENPTSAVFSNKLLISYENKIVILLDIESQLKVETYLLRKKPVCARYVHSKSAVFIADKFGDLYILNHLELKALTAQSIRHLKNHLNTNTKDEKAYKLHNELVTELGEMDNEQITNEKNFAYGTHLGYITSVYMNLDRTTVFSGDLSNRIRIAPCEENNYFEIYGYALGHKDYIQDICCFETSKDNKTCIFCSISGDRTLTIWSYDKTTLFTEEKTCTLNDTYSLINIPLKIYCVETNGVFYILLLQNETSNILCLPLDNFYTIDKKEIFQIDLKRNPIALQIVEADTLESLNTDNIISINKHQLIYWIDHFGVLQEPILFDKNNISLPTLLNQKLPNYSIYKIDNWKHFPKSTKLTKVFSR